MFIALVNQINRLALCHDVNRTRVAIKSILKFKDTTFGRHFSDESAMSAFKGKSDHFNGITVVSEDEACDGESFKDVLERSLQTWVDENKRGIWFKVYLNQSDWIPVLANSGFKYHHAQTDYVMMYKWLPKDEECNIPPYAHTMIGVGAVVVNDKDEVLVVNEKHYHLPHWKLPGGYVEPRENLADAAIREVYEETNIHTQFLNILTFRHGHGGQFGCSDLYTVVCLKPLSTEIKKCDREINECIWMPISEYMCHPHIHELNRFFVKKYLDNKRDHVRIECTHGIHQVLKRPYTVYHASIENEPNKL